MHSIVAATGQLLGGPLAETGPRAERGPRRQNDTSKYLFRAYFTQFEENFEIGVGDFERCSMLPVRKTADPQNTIFPTVNVCRVSSKTQFGTKNENLPQKAAWSILHIQGIVALNCHSTMFLHSFLHPKSNFWPAVNLIKTC